MSPFGPSAVMFNQTGQAYVGTQTKNAYRGVEREYEPFGGPFPCTIQVSSRALVNRGPGEAEVGVWMFYAPIAGAPALQAGMIVEILEGSELGKRVRINDPYRPRNRFQQSRCVQWDGVLIPDEATS